MLHLAIRNSSSTISSVFLFLTHPFVTSKRKSGPYIKKKWSESGMSVSSSTPTTLPVREAHNLAVLGRLYPPPPRSKTGTPIASTSSTQAVMLSNVRLNPPMGSLDRLSAPHCVTMQSGLKLVMMEGNKEVKMCLYILSVTPPSRGILIL